MSEICKNIKACRVAANLTQEQVAEKIFTTRQAVSSYETGRTQPGIDVLQRLASALAVPQEVLLYGDAAKKRRVWFNKAAYITLAVYIGAVLISSALLWGLNQWMAFPSGTPVSSANRDMLNMRFALLRVQNGLQGLTLSVSAVAATVLLCFDVSIQPRATLRAKAVYALVLVLGTAAAALPWSAFDPVYRFADYALMPFLGLAMFGLALAADLGITLVLKKRRRKSSIG